MNIKVVQGTDKGSQKETNSCTHNQETCKTQSTEEPSLKRQFSSQTEKRDLSEPQLFRIKGTDAVMRSQKNASSQTRSEQLDTGGKSGLEGPGCNFKPDMSHVSSHTESIGGMNTTNKGEMSKQHTTYAAKIADESEQVRDTSKPSSQPQENPKFIFTKMFSIKGTDTTKVREIENPRVLLKSCQQRKATTKNEEMNNPDTLMKPTYSRKQSEH